MKFLLVRSPRAAGDGSGTPFSVPELPNRAALPQQSTDPETVLNKKMELRLRDHLLHVINGQPLSLTVNFGWRAPRSMVSAANSAIWTCAFAFSLKKSKKVDLNRNNPVGIRTTHLMYHYSRLDNRVAPLVMVVKKWAARQNINDTSVSTLFSISRLTYDPNSGFTFYLPQAHSA